MTREEHGDEFYLGAAKLIAGHMAASWIKREWENHEWNRTVHTPLAIDFVRQVSVKMWPADFDRKRFDELVQGVAEKIVPQVITELRRLHEGEVK